MKKQFAWKALSAKNQHLIQYYFAEYLVMGIYLILIGSALPKIQAEYQLSYRISGMMLSVQSIGYLAAGTFVGLIPRYFGAKRTSLVLDHLAFLGLAIIILTGHPIILLFAMLLTGISKGTTGNFGNQIVSNLSGNDGGMLNLAQAFFAIGACVAPLLAMACGVSWRISFAIVIVVGVLQMLCGAKIRIGPEAYTWSETGKNDFSFFKKTAFWLCAVILLCYLAIEASVMGWLVTYFVDSGAANETTAQLLATGLWGALLVGRFLSAWASQRVAAYQLIAVMTVGIIVCFTLLLLSHTLLPMIVSTMGLGLCMAGMYGTAISDSEDLLERYPMCMGMFIAIPGIGAAAAPSLVGFVSDFAGIRSGMAMLYIFVAVLAVTTTINVVYQKQRNRMPEVVKSCE